MSDLKENAPIFKPDRVMLPVSAQNRASCVLTYARLDLWGRCSDGNHKIKENPSELPIEGHPRSPRSQQAAVRPSAQESAAARLRLRASVALCAAARLGRIDRGRTFWPVRVDAVPILPASIGAPHQGSRRQDEGARRRRWYCWR
jgi:hypothetical protein